MSMEYLGEGFDIHGGGADLTFPHHENEIAQSEAATGKPFARYWIHNGFVNIRSEKMSKSLGNVLNIREILKDVHPEQLRLFLLSSHYRSPLDYSENSIEEAAAALERLYAALESLQRLIRGQGTAQELPEELAGITERFRQAMDDDFNTPRGLAVLFEAARAVNRIATEAGSSKIDIPSPDMLSAVQQEVTDLAREVLGLLNEEPQAFLEDMRDRDLRRLQDVKDQAGDAGGAFEVLDKKQIEAKISERAEARKKKDFARADEIRQWLTERKVHLKDGPDGTTWEIID